MVQEELHREDSEVIVDDNTLLDGEVGAEVSDVSEKVDHIRIGWLKEFLGLYNTKIGALKIADLDKLRSANDNNVESKKAA